MDHMPPMSPEVHLKHILSHPSPPDEVSYNNKQNNNSTEQGNITIQYCAKVMQTYFAEIHDFSWLFDEKISNFRWKRIFSEKSR